MVGMEDAGIDLRRKTEIVAIDDQLPARASRWGHTPHPRVRTPSYISNTTTPASQPQHDSNSLRQASPHPKGYVARKAVPRLPSAGRKRGTSFSRYSW